MNGKNLFDGVFFSPWGTKILQSPPTLTSTSELEMASNKIFLTPIEVLDEFLKKKFNNGIVEFMLLYTEKHFGKAFCLPVVFSPTVRCLFYNSDDPDWLSQTLTDYQSAIKVNSFGNTYLNLHTNDIYKFTLMKANFSLKENAEKFLRGYHYTINNFQIFIQSSIQGDLTLLYEEL